MEERDNGLNVSLTSTHMANGHANFEAFTREPPMAELSEIPQEAFPDQNRA